MKADIDCARKLVNGITLAKREDGRKDAHWDFSVWTPAGAPS
jgi:hypothetical protein